MGNIVTVGMLVCLVAASACGGKKAPLVAAQGSLGVAKVIGEAQAAVQQAARRYQSSEGQEGLSPVRALFVQEKLNTANEAVAKAIPFLRAAQAAVDKGEATSGDLVTKALAAAQEAAAALAPLFGEQGIPARVVVALEKAQEAYAGVLDLIATINTLRPAPQGV